MTQEIKRLHLSGFSLIELTIVLIIVTLLAGGLMMSLGAQRDVQQLLEVRRQLSDIREALLGYAIANGRLPPPADPSIASGTTGAGEIDEGRTQGVIPWATLGLPETDPWGQRFTYRAHSRFSDAIAANTVPACALSTPSPPSQASFVLCSQGNITVSDGSTNVATDLPAIVVSHGKNGLGGYRSDGSQVPGALLNELENANGDDTFVSRVQAVDFDDELTWVPLHILMNRMISAGRLP